MNLTYGCSLSNLTLIGERCQTVVLGILTMLGFHLQQWMGDLILYMKVDLHIQKNWVRVQELPLVFQSSEFGECIGSKLGVVYQVINIQYSDRTEKFL